MASSKNSKASESTEPSGKSKRSTTRTSARPTEAARKTKMVASAGRRTEAPPPAPAPEASVAQSDAKEVAAATAQSPARIHLDPTDRVFETDSPGMEWRRNLEANGFKVVGEFVLRRLPVKLCGLIKPPHVLAMVGQIEDVLWVDLVAYYADDSTETWTNSPVVSESVPWNTMHRMQGADAVELCRALEACQSKKERRPVAAEDYCTIVEANYSRNMAWSNSSATGSPLQSDADRKIDELVMGYAQERIRKWYVRNSSFKPESSASGRKILRLSADQQVKALLACFRLRTEIEEFTKTDVTEDLRAILLRLDLRYQDDQMEALAHELHRRATRSSIFIDPIYEPLLEAIERHARVRSLTPKAIESLLFARSSVLYPKLMNYGRPFQARIEAIAGDLRGCPPIHLEEPWAAAVRADFKTASAESWADWLELFEHCTNTPGAQPKPKWRNAARSLVQKIGVEEFRSRLEHWLSMFDEPRTDDQWRQERMRERGPLAISDHSQDVLCGLVWCCELFPDERAVRMLSAAAVSAYRKIPTVGPRAVRVGNAAVTVMGEMGLPASLTQLAILSVRLKVHAARLAIEKQIAKTAAKLGVPRDELEEMSVPAFGFDEVGPRREAIGDTSVEMRVDGAGVQIVWLDSQGKTLKAPPAAVKKQYAEELKEIKAQAKEAEQMLAAQRWRIERLYLQPKSWPLAIWRERYLDHPLVGTIARRLIWRFHDGKRSVAAFFADGALRDAHDRPVEFQDDARVELWHPHDEPQESVLAWRIWLEGRELRQPFKQAHREIYLLAPAERATGSYSNRFAAHILRQSQYRALAQTREWTVDLQGGWDGGQEGRAKRTLPAFDLRAEFWTTDPGEMNDANEVSQGNAYIATDQVRFYRPANAKEPIPLADVPPIAFSEIMRDVDLFVGVASVGNDPTWNDGGPNGRFVDYWSTFAFGELSVTANARRELLGRLIPRLRIADRCTLDERFLIVRGDRRVYKIHLASANVLMSPNDQYLCIVPSKADNAAEKLYVPFEGDGTLAHILSKALLLAEDKKIKDPSILGQL